MSHDNFQPPEHDEPEKDDDDRMYGALSDLAGIDTSDTNLRDHPKAYEVLDRLMTHAYAEGRKDQSEDAAAAPDIQFRLRIARLLAELHGESVLSEQQCARYMGIDLVSWRRLEHCFSAGTSFVEGDGEEFPAEDCETILRRAPDSSSAAGRRG